MNLALGTVQFGLPYGISNSRGQIPFKECQKIIQYAREVGIHYLDTAIAYGDSELVLGNIGIKDFQVVTKLPAISVNLENIKNWILTSIDESLRRLKISKLYALLLHKSRDLSFSFKEEIYQSVVELKKQGKIEKFGISIYHHNELEELYDPKLIDIVQSPLNILDRELLYSAWLEKLKSNGCEVQVRSIFLQGLLLMNRNERPGKFNKWGWIWERWESWLQQNQISALEACLGFVKSISGIDQIIVGVDSLDHLKAIYDVYSKKFLYSFPEEIFSKDPYLINPSLWSKL